MYIFEYIQFGCFSKESVYSYSSLLAPVRSLKINISNLPKKVMLVIFSVHTCAPFFGAHPSSRFTRITISRLNYIWQPCSHRIYTFNLYNYPGRYHINPDIGYVIWRILYGLSYNSSILGAYNTRYIIWPISCNLPFFTNVHRFLYPRILEIKTRMKGKFRLSWRVEQMEVSICLKSESVNG